MQAIFPFSSCKIVMAATTGTFFKALIANIVVACLAGNALFIMLGMTKIH